MADIRRWTKQQEATIQPLNAQQNRCEQDLSHALEEYKTLCAHAANFDLNALWCERLQERESLTAEVRAELKTRLGADYRERRLDFAEQQICGVMLQEEQKLRKYRKENCARGKKRESLAEETAR